MATLTFFPLGNADTTLLQLNTGQVILFDYAHMKCDNNDDKRIDLPTELNKRVSGDFDIVCFTHADKDHINRFSEYFFLEHAYLYQSGQRKKIKEMWVPAAVLTEEGITDENRILRAEARYRLKKKTGIKVFSRPKKLREWCNRQSDICYDDICHLIVDAGKLIPGFNKQNNGVELFVHSPFFSGSANINRNNEAIVLQATFNDRCETKFILGSDINSESWTDIVNVTNRFGNQVRLLWDIFHISHHCSYTALTNSEKGSTKTEPCPNVKWLFEQQGKYGSRLISPSCSIEYTDTILPPHFQAANYYKQIALNKGGEFIVTMDYPKPSNPRPLVFEIDQSNCLRKIIEEEDKATFVYIKPRERAGNNE